MSYHLLSTSSLRTTFHEDSSIKYHSLIFESFIRHCQLYRETSQI